jgi:hypothetical protein
MLGARYLGNGTLDNSFSTDGIQTTAFTYADGTHQAEATSVLVEDATVIAGGSAYTSQASGSKQFAAVRYLDDGTLDPAFGTGG